MNNPTPLTLTDPLAGKDVTLVITLPAGDGSQARDERPALLSIGRDGQAPLFRQGVMADLVALINDAWTAFGVQAELIAAQAQAAPDSAAGAAETVAEADAAAEDAAGSTGEEAALPPNKSAPPPPKPKNLSLF